MKWFIFLSELWIVSQVIHQSLPWRSYRSGPWGRWEDSRAACWRPCCLPVHRTGQLSRLVCVYVWDGVSRGLSSVGQKTHFSAVVQPEEIPALATAGVMEVLVCWNALSVSQFLLSPLAFYKFSSPSPLTLLPPLSSSRLSSPLHLCLNPFFFFFLSHSSPRHIF